MSISVALPEWFFSKDKDAAPIILLTLLLGGIVLPLGLAACYLGRSAQYTGGWSGMHAVPRVQGGRFVPGRWRYAAAASAACSPRKPGLHLPLFSSTARTRTPLPQVPTR